MQKSDFECLYLGNGAS